MGVGQDARVGALDVLLLAQFLEAGQEALVEGAVRLGLALELLLLGLVLAGRAGDDGGLVDQLLELVLLGLGGVELGAHGQRDALGLAQEAGAHAGELGARLDHLGMVVAQHRRQLGHLAGQLDVLDAQRRQGGVARHLGDVGDLAGIEAGPAQRDEARLALDALGARADVLAVEIGQRLGRHRPFGAAGQALVAAVGGDGLLGDLQVAAQLGQALLEPLGGAAVGLVLGVDLVGEIGLGHGIGDARRHRAVRAFDGDQDDEGAAQQRDAEAAGDGTDRRAAARIALLGRAAGARRLGGGGLRLGRRRQQGRDAGGPQFAQRRKGAIDEAWRLGAVEIRIVGEPELVDDAADQELGLDDLELALDGAEVHGVDARQRRLGAHHLEGARIQQQAGRRFVHRRGLRDDQRHQRNGDEAAADDQRLAAVEQAQPFPQLVGSFAGAHGGQSARLGRRNDPVYGPIVHDLLGLRKRSHPT